ncbi:hypothetical protein Enr17x_27960 [Gimesia fumaroli]|uniref:Uncharacterized protein n=1 Tax=Gimesia fumaroli TaxID=2527976 RepID=A0A518ICD6_9PLAN|nr:hypothetical protein Enr17x_27960 [Gimesia fumaroli]
MRSESGVWEASYNCQSCVKVTNNQRIKVFLAKNTIETTTLVHKLLLRSLFRHKAIAGTTNRNDVYRLSRITLDQLT